MTFYVEIECGNDAMQTSKQVAEALRVVADRVEDNDYCEVASDDLVRGIKDENGNTVGSFGFKINDGP